MEKESRIGTLNEHTLHLALKNLLEPDSRFHEIPCAGYVADTLRDGVITEIETRSFANLQKKLGSLLSAYRVRAVFPVAVRRWVSFVDPLTGAVGEKKRSSRPGKPADVFRELYRIREHLTDENFSLLLAEVEVVEYRKKTGRNRKLDRVPLAVLGLRELRGREDYRSLAVFPEGTFTAAAFASRNRLRQRDAWYAISVLLSLGILSRTGRQGNAFLYREEQSATAPPPGCGGSAPCTPRQGAEPPAPPPALQ